MTFSATSQKNDLNSTNRRRVQAVVIKAAVVYVCGKKEENTCSSVVLPRSNVNILITYQVRF